MRCEGTVEYCAWPGQVQARGMDAENNARFAGVAEAAVRGGLGGFAPQHLSLTAWVFATAGHVVPGALLDGIATKTLSISTETVPQLLFCVASFASCVDIPLFLGRAPIWW